MDLHHLQRQATGNETWARNIATHLFGEGGHEYAAAVTTGAVTDDLVVQADERVVVSASSAKRLLWDMPRAIRRMQSDVVLVQYSMPLTRVPCVVAVHDLSFEQPQAHQWLSLKTRLRYRATIRASVLGAAHVVALSEHTRRDLITHYRIPADKISVVYAAASAQFIESVQGVPRRNRPIATVLAVGNVIPRKNLETLALAIKHIREHGRDMQLRVVGAIPAQGQRIAQRITSLLGNHVSFTGYVNDAALAHEYRSAHVVAFPSHYEGFGIPVLEAMAAETPVVCNGTSCLPEIAGDAALVIPEGASPADWAVALESAAWNDELRCKLIARGSTRVGSYSWATSAAQLTRILEDAAEGTGAERGR